MLNKDMLNKDNTTLYNITNHISKTLLHGRNPDDYNLVINDPRKYPNLLDTCH